VKIFGVPGQGQYLQPKGTTSLDAREQCVFAEQSARPVSSVEQSSGSALSARAAVFVPGALQHVSRPLSGVSDSDIELLRLHSRLESVADITKCFDVWSDELMDDIMKFFY
jgi:hypothetical protein